MQDPHDFRIVATEQKGVRKESLTKADPAATPFKVVIDPKVRLDLRHALIDLIDYHDEALAEHFAEGKLALESYKEYIELFARSLKVLLAALGGLRSAGRGYQFESGIALEEGAGAIRFESAIAGGARLISPIFRGEETLVLPLSISMVNALKTCVPRLKNSWFRGS